jgi:hypothetical protein
MNSVTDVSGVGGEGLSGFGGGKEEVQANVKPKRKWPRYLLRGALVFAAALALGQLMYTYSGDGKWQYVDQGRGVTVYSQKASGTNTKKFMAVFRVKGTLSQVTAFLGIQGVAKGKSAGLLDVLADAFGLPHVQARLLREARGHARSEDQGSSVLADSQTVHGA